MQQHGNMEEGLLNILRFKKMQNISQWGENKYKCIQNGQIAQKYKDKYIRAIGTLKKKFFSCYIIHQ